MLRVILTWPRGSTQQSYSCTANYHPSKLHEPDMQETAGEVGTSS